MSNVLSFTGMINIILMVMLQVVTPTMAFQGKFFGEWMLWHSTVTNLPVNRAVVHIYPDQCVTISFRFTRGPFVFHKMTTGTYCIHPMTENDTTQKVDVGLHQTVETFLSAYGIGLQDMNIHTSKRSINKKYQLTMTNVGMDDIYFHSRMNRDDAYFHLVRSIRVNEPSVDIPITTFIITQIIGTIIGHMINLFLFHTN